MPEKNTILLVDDVPDNLRLLSAMLQQTGHVVRAATSAKRALAAARSAPPSLILLDIKMPQMDGLEMCRQLKADAALQHIPVIFISAINDTEDKLKAFQAGGMDYITKPFQEREVLARVTAHLELYRQKVALEAMNRRLKELESQRDSLTHMIVHDMNTPLMVVKAQLEMIQMFDKATLSRDALHRLGEAKAGADRLERMISEMLLVSKLEAGKLAPQLTPSDLVALARQVAAAACPANDPYQIKIHLAANPDRVTLPLDPELIERVLQNLLGNAVKFSPASGTIQLKITAASGQVRVSVSDAGPGIAPEFHQQIFEKFGQVEGGTNRRGAGLGLTFCKLAVEAHGGSIGVDSQAGQGSTFWFTLGWHP